MGTIIALFGENCSYKDASRMGSNIERYIKTALNPSMQVEVNRIETIKLPDHPTPEWYDIYPIRVEVEMTISVYNDLDTAKHHIQALHYFKKFIDISEDKPAQVNTAIVKFVENFRNHSSIFSRSEQVGVYQIL